MVYQIAKLANITSNKLWFMIARTAKVFMGNINQLKHHKKMGSSASEKMEVLYYRRPYIVRVYPLKF